MTFKNDPAIVVVDDEHLMLTIYTLFFKDKYSNVVMFEDPFEALDYMAQKTAEGSSIDLLITDYHMPGMDGCVLSEKTRKIVPEIKIIMATAYESVIGVKSIDAFIQKPFTDELIYLTIDDVLGENDAISA